VAGWREPPIADEGKLWDIVDALVEIAEGKGISAARVALAWLLGRPGVTSLIVGGRTEGAIQGQSRERRGQAHRRGARPARQDQPADAALPLLASGTSCERPPRRGGFGAARARI